MADTTHIEWTDATWNPITGCSIVDAGCTNCYAMQLAGTRLRNHPSRAGLTRVSGGRPKWTGEVRFNEQWLDQPLRWTRPRMIFVCAHGDLFHEAVPDEWIDQVFAIMADCPQHTFQVLTKRPERMASYLTTRRAGKSLQPPIGGGLLGYHPFNSEILPPRNIWIGTSISDQASADLRIPHLLATPAAVRFLSAEPLLGPVDLRAVDPGIACGAWCKGGCGVSGDNECGRESPSLDWVIVGGESGPGARPMHPDWARSLRDQCVAAGVPFFFKQWGEWESVYDRDRDDPDWRNVPKAGDRYRKRWLNLAGGQGFHGDKLNMMKRIGKRAAGRLLDGRTWDQMPGVRDG
ncbi:phage Gp37/Gp68 family protein [Gemmobacter nectariphilus]|uniref:phage Gp37/Gp68 family protein n=1 Tax=Gemmobacter nectariphilus TaxID=220343 RepID=UPI0004109C67|nr:phage Gp37/Gp68 family protein [Gemmobacter nectariphilus]